MSDQAPAALAPAHDAPKVRLGTLTSAEAAARLAAGATVLLPLGSHEDQGPHAPMGDYLSAERISEMIAGRAIGQGHDTLVAPVLPFGGRDFFGSRPGGMALEQSTLRLVLRDMLDGLLRHDFTRLIVVNGHGGNAQAIHDVTQAVLLERGVLIPSFYLWKIAGGLLPELLDPVQARASAGHGADPLASVAMHLFPELMRPDLIPSSPPLPRSVAGLFVSGFGTARFEGVEIGLPIELGDDAVTGDASLCSAETGALITERLVSLGAAFIAHLTNHMAWQDLDG
ncbi:creatininase family protein [Lichenicola sp.]|uniref:creatininase family protein n=1 Tax=Lichenicola sp. TaxID=2804529 RepID=UPI003AFFB7C9